MPDVEKVLEKLDDQQRLVDTRTIEGCKVNVPLQRPLQRKNSRAGFPHIVEMAVPLGGFGAWVAESGSANYSALFLGGSLGGVPCHRSGSFDLPN